MSFSEQDTVPYRSFRLNEYRPVAQYDMGVPRYETTHGTFDNTTDADELTIGLLLLGLTAYRSTPAIHSQYHRRIGAPARVEFFNSIFRPVTSAMRGAAVYDSYGNFLLHATNALLGYDGSGPHLSRRILEMMGVRRQLFDAANDVAKSRNSTYTIIFSREPRKVIDDTEYVIFGDEVEEWEFWGAETPI